MKNIRRLQDVQINDADIVETYRETFNNESIEEAHNIINTDTLKSYVLQAEWMNDSKTKIEELEQYKVTKCDNVIKGKTEEFQFNIDEFIKIGQYNSSVQYYKNNFVSYNEEIYFCIQNALNKVPTDTSYWLKIGLRGEKGNYDLSVVCRGLWNYSTEYRKYDLVSYKNNLYIAKRNNIHSYPIPVDTYYLNDDLHLNNTLYLESEDTYPEREMNFLNNSLFLNNNIYLRNIWTDDDWFLLTSIDNTLQIYDSPEDYTQLPIYSIFFQKL